MKRGEPCVLWGRGPVIVELGTSVTSFIERYIQSLWQLELVLHVRSAGRPISAAELSRRLYISSEIIGAATESLADKQVLQKTSDLPPRFLLSNKPGIKQAIDATAAAYAKNRIELIDYIFSSKTLES
ncbi:MAG TPA: hypothetical protein V6C72_14350 [Chroococcales cyanobacterium]